MDEQDLSELYKNKDLIDQAKIPTAVDGYNRRNWIKAALPEEAELQTYSTSGYQGKMSFVIRLDGEIWLHNDYYGSCSYCDGFLDNEKYWTEHMLQKAYCFENEEYAVEYLRRTEDYSWRGYDNIVEPTVEMVENSEKNRHEA